jgi:predicted RNA binding protein YcfA (HicA-like mRNA interferase family)
MSGKSDANVSFEDVCNLLLRLGFALRQQGTSHRIFSLADSYLNLQPGSGGKAKKYQVRQIREELKRINLRP